MPEMPEIPLVPSLWRFPAQPESVGRARRLAMQALPYRLRSQLADELGLVTSELVTNALRYGTTAPDEEVIELVVWPADGHYWVAVSDPGDGKPALASPGPEAESGRGLVLVDTLSAAWGVLPRRARGKSVVAGLRLHGG